MNVLQAIGAVAVVILGVALLGMFIFGIFQHRSDVPRLHAVKAGMLVVLAEALTYPGVGLKPPTMPPPPKPKSKVLAMVNGRKSS